MAAAGCSREYPTARSWSPALMISQSFLYNAIFFTYTLVLTNFYGVSPRAMPIYFMAFASGTVWGH